MCRVQGSRPLKTSLLAIDPRENLARCDLWVCTRRSVLLPAIGTEHQVSEPG